MLARSPEEVAWAFHETLLEMLRRLNQAAERRSDDSQGMEYGELERAMAGFWTVFSGESDLDRALQLLVENGLVTTSREPAWSWDRHRMLGERFEITALGKSYLLRQIEQTERIR